MSKELKETGLTFEEMVAKELEKQRIEFENKLKQRETNKCEIAGTCVELIIIEGKPIIDKETKQQKEINGELCFYPNRYSYRHSFEGGAIEISVNKDIYDSLVIGDKYLAIGRFSSVTEFGNTVIKPVFSQIQKI